jgi:hypothetical protein
MIDHPKEFDYPCASSGIRAVLPEIAAYYVEASDRESRVVGILNDDCALVATPPAFARRHPLVRIV